MNTIDSRCYGAVTVRDARNLRIFSLWIAALGIWLIASLFLIEARLFEPNAAAWLLPLGGLVLGVMAVRAYVVFLRYADELLRKIHLEGLAWGMGAALIFMPVYRMCERLGAPRLDSVDPLAVIVIAWAFGQWRGLRHYAVEDAA